MVLKNIAIQQNDTISALEFHKKEINKYAQELKGKKSFSNCVDRRILGIERCVSDYGTNPLKAIGWYCILIIALSIAYYIETYIRLNAPCLNFFELLLGILLPWKVGLEDFKCYHVISLIAQPILIYKIIKSFRKFSRRL